MWVAGGLQLKREERVAGEGGGRHTPQREAALPRVTQLSKVFPSLWHIDGNI